MSQAEVEKLGNLTARPVAEVPSSVVAEGMNRGFEGYLVSVRTSAEGLERRTRGEHLDPFASRVLLCAGLPAGVVLIARRGWTSRVAALGIAPELRGGGAGRAVMELVIEEARRRGERTLVLEVIEQNTRAVRLYDALGFERGRRLVGWRRGASGAADARPLVEVDPLIEVDPLEVSRVVAREGARDLPWMLAPETLSSATPPARAFSLDDKAWALIADGQAETLSLSALVVAREARGQGLGARLVRALEARFGGRAWSVTPVVPEGLACRLFESAGWERHAFSQLEMRLSL